MGNEKNGRGITEEEKSIYRRMMEFRMQPKVEGAVDHSTCWKKPSEILHREKQPYMMGEGLGNTPFITPKYFRSYSPKEFEEEEAATAQYRNELAERSRELHERQKRSREKLREALPKKISSGEVLVRQRIYNLLWSKREWEILATNEGGLLPGMDVADTPFGQLLIVPVIEEDEAEEMNLLEEKVPESKQLADLDGRRFWISAEVKDFVKNVFGHVNWSRPLTIKEAEQFGVKL